MPRRLDLRALRRDEGFTGAERALLLCVGLAVVVLGGVLLRAGTGQAASDAARTLRSGAGPLGAIQSTAALPEARLLRAAGAFPEAAPPVPAGARSAAREAPAPEAAQPEAPAPAVVTVGDTAGTRRTFTDKVYQRHLQRLRQLRVNVTDAGMKADLARFVKNWEANHARYEAVAAMTGVPAKLIAALHWRESSGNFKTYLHQGDPLGRPAVHWPTNIPVFHKWEDAAVHALNMKGRIKKDLGLTANTTDLAALATYAEFYNGLGYYNRGRSSPYVYSGTNQYDRGKYVADGVYDPNHRDRQLGVVTMIEAISTRGPVAAPAPPPGRGGQPAPAPSPGPAAGPRRAPHRRGDRSAPPAATGAFRWRQRAR